MVRMGVSKTCDVGPIPATPANTFVDIVKEAVWTRVRIPAPPQNQ